MAIQDESALLADAKTLFEKFSRKAENSKGKLENDDGSDSILESMNKAVLEAVNSTAREPMLELMNTANKGIESSRDVSNAVKELPGPLKHELEELPSTLEMESLTNHLSSTIRDVVDKVRAASSDPSVLYPRLLCGSIPVDPAKVGNLAKRYKALELLDGEGGGTDSMAQARGMKGPPNSSAEAVGAISGTFNGVVEPLLAAIDGLKEVQETLVSTRKSVQDLDGCGDEFEDLLSNEAQVSDFVERITGLFSPDGPGTPISSSSSNTATRSAGSSQSNSIQRVEEGAELVRSARAFQEPLELCIEKAKAVGDRCSLLAEKLKKLFELALDSFGKIVELLKVFISTLPRIATEVKQFFVPTGLRALLLRPSEDTKSLIAAIEALKSSVPEPTEVEQRSRRALSDSESSSNVLIITSKITEVINTPVELISRLSTLSTELPQQIIVAAKEALQSWAEDFGEGMMVDKIEDGLENVAQMMGSDLTGDEIGEKIGETFGGLLPFGSNGKKTENDADCEKEEGVFGGLLQSLF